MTFFIYVMYLDLGVKPNYSKSDTLRHRPKIPTFFLVLFL